LADAYTLLQKAVWRELHFISGFSSELPRDFLLAICLSQQKQKTK
jgi:hypothetical protein